MIDNWWGHLFMWQNIEKIGSLNGSYINFLLLRNMWVFAEYRQCTYLIFEILSPLRTCIGSLKRQRWPQPYFTNVIILLISARLRNLIEFLGLISKLNSLSSLWIISMRKVINLVLSYFLFSFLSFILLTFA